MALLKAEWSLLKSSSPALGGADDDDLAAILREILARTIGRTYPPFHWGLARGAEGLGECAPFLDDEEKCAEAARIATFRISCKTPRPPSWCTESR